MKLFTLARPISASSITIFCSFKGVDSGPIFGWESSAGVECNVSIDILAGDLTVDVDGVSVVISGCLSGLVKTAWSTIMLSLDPDLFRVVRSDGSEFSEIGIVFPGADNLWVGGSKSSSVVTSNPGLGLFDIRAYGNVRSNSSFIEYARDLSSGQNNYHPDFRRNA